MKALKLPFTFDPNKIAAEIAQFSEDDYYFIYNTYVTENSLRSKHLIEPVNDSDGIPVFLPNEALKKCPYLLSILETFNCKKETFRIHSLAGGAVIKPHHDMCCGFEYGKVRLHIPVQTNDKVVLKVEEQPIKMEPGESWYCNFHLKHEVQNNSDQQRVHLILDCLVNDWVKDIFEKASSHAIH